MYVLKTKNKTVNLVFKTRKIVEVANLLDGENFEDVYFKAINKLDLEALANIIDIFSEDEFDSFDDVYDYIDLYKDENKKTYLDIFVEIAKAINSEGFFMKKMDEKEIEEKILNPLSQINLDKMMKESLENAMKEMTKELINKEL